MICNRCGRECPQREEGYCLQCLVAIVRMKRKTYEPTETDIKRQVKDYLKLKGVFHYHNLQGLGCYPGLPDMCLHLKDRVVYLEIKTPKGKLSMAQQLFKWQCEVDGIQYWVVRSVEDLEEKINDAPNLGFT